MALREAVLGLVFDEPKSGYEIKRFYGETIRNFWNVSDGQLYPTLKKMRNEGLVQREVVQQAKAANKHVYSITEQGREVFLDWLAQPELKFQEMKEPFVMQMFFYDKLSKKEVLRHLEAQLENHGLLIEEFTDVEATYRDQLTPYQALIAETGVLYVQLRAIWLRRLIQLVRRDQVNGEHRIVPDEQRELLETFSQAVLGPESEHE